MSIRVHASNFSPTERGRSSLVVCEIIFAKCRKKPFTKTKALFYSCVCFVSVCLEAERSEGMNPACCHVKHISVLQMWFSLGWRPKRLAKPDCLPLLFFLPVFASSYFTRASKKPQRWHNYNDHKSRALHRQGLPTPPRHLCLFVNFPSALPITSLTLVHKEFSTPDQMIV